MMLLLILTIPSLVAGRQSAAEPDVAIRTEKVVGDLGTCGVTFEFLPDGRIICGELRNVLSKETARVGKIRLIENNTMLPDPLLVLDVYADYKNPPDNTVFDERGVIGLALDPNFSDNHYVYVAWTYLVDESTNQTAKQVARFTLIDNKLVDKKVLLDGIPAAKQHMGGPLEFGPDGKLYVTGGEAGQQREAQNPDSILGKILRINSDGTIPADNPFPGKPYFTMGHRNSFGIAFHPLTGVPYISENGPDTHDEINMLIPGKNYGWPEVLGTSSDSRFISPIVDTGNGTVAPTELEFYKGDRYPAEMQNDLFYLAYNPRSLERLKLEAPGYDKVEAHFSYPLLLTGIGSYTDIELGPDGYFYVSDFKSIYRVIFEPSNGQVLEATTPANRTVKLTVTPSTGDNSTLRFSVQIRDQTNTELLDIPYSLQISQNGAVIHTAEGRTSPVPSQHEYVFEMTGPAEVVIKDINDTDDSARFDITVIPEFPTPLVLAPILGAVMILLGMLGKLRPATLGG